MAVAKTATAVAKPVAKAISAIKLVEEPEVTVTKETATTSKVKTTPGNKTTEQKETAVKKEVVKKETTAKKQAVKKETVKKEVAAKKETVKKAVKKAATSIAKKEPTTKESVKKEIVHLQFDGKSYSQEQLVQIAKDVWVYDLGKKLNDFKEVELFVKPEESLVYYIINKKENGSFAI